MTPELDPRRMLSELVSIPSPSRSEGPAADWVVGFCREQNLSCERLGDNVLVRVGSGGAGPRLLLNSHLDTVPVGTGWSGDPFDGRWRGGDGPGRGGRLTARGANDAKSSAVAMLWATAELARGESLPGELILALVACEEVDNSGMATVLEHLGHPDAAVTGEPTGLEVVRAQSGLGVLEAEWTGRSCHAAHVGRVEHENAMLKAASELAGLPGFITLWGEHELLGPSTIVATQLSAGKRHNVVPDRAVAVFDARLAHPHTARECLETLSELLPGATVTIRSERLHPVETPDGHPLVRLALRAAGKSAAIGSNTLSDMALLGSVPAIKCGPGVTERSHTPDEFVTEDELLDACRFYRELAPAVLATLREEVAAR